MAFDFEKLKRDVLTAGKTAGDKVNEASQIVKLKIDLKTREDSLQKQFASLGQMYYQAQAGAPANPEEAEIFEAIANINAEIRQIKEELEGGKEAPEEIFCPQCGMKQPKGNAFCTSCGASLQ